ncbi:uncharacterized protein CDAR_270521 [Caerostris darwini]|uniref:Uncharacterized protein n=1 Tax=Caerostris darwini TaxID=1538125 RepID=A0AAV4NGY9_9ARAC|nr:uncharacterized protein CDAR_270521 [Caerostris darwini]
MSVISSFVLPLLPLNQNLFSTRELSYSFILYSVERLARLPVSRIGRAMWSLKIVRYSRVAKTPFEVLMGRLQWLQSYCQKDGDFKEYGRLPSVKRTSNAFADVLNAAENGDINSIKGEYPRIFIRYKANNFGNL